MNTLFLHREPVVARRTTGTSRCESRGYCGPFANESFYNAFPESWWHGMGDCRECGTTCKVTDEGRYRTTRTAA